MQSNMPLTKNSINFSSESIPHPLQTKNVECLDKLGMFNKLDKCKVRPGCDKSPLHRLTSIILPNLPTHYRGSLTTVYQSRKFLKSGCWNRSRFVELKDIKLLLLQQQHQKRDALKIIRMLQKSYRANHMTMCLRWSSKPIQLTVNCTSLHKYIYVSKTAGVKIVTFSGEFLIE